MPGRPPPARSAATIAPDDNTAPTWSCRDGFSDRSPDDSGPVGASEAKSSSGEMKIESLHVPGSWVLGTLVALALREALTQPLPHIFDLTSHLHKGSPEHLRILWLESIRLCTVLLVTIRFYMGSVEFFERARQAPESTNVGYGLDFLFGFFHFLLFVAWAATIEVPNLQQVAPPYLWLLGGILFYDLPWCIARRKGPNRETPRLWCAVNMATLLLCIAIYSMGLFWRQDLRDIWEDCILIFVIVVSFLDLWGILIDDPLFPKWVRALVPAG